jgi:hypothetical protein
MRCDLRIPYFYFPLLNCILWIVLVIQLSPVLHPGSLVFCHNFHGLCLTCRKQSKPESALFRSGIVCVLTTLYAKAILAVKAPAAFSGSSTVSVWIHRCNKKCEKENLSQQIGISNSFFYLSTVRPGGLLWS